MKNAVCRKKNIIFFLEFAAMPKTGKPDCYWNEVMRQYASGDFKFKTGQTPGSKKWKNIRKQIDKCPCHMKINLTDLFGKSVVCRCGYHKVSELDIFLGGNNWLILTELSSILICPFSLIDNI